MTSHATRLLTLTCHASLLMLPGGCSEAPLRGGPDLGGTSSTGDSSGPAAPGGPGGSDEPPTTGSPSETSTTDATASSSTSGAPAPFCGDGILDPGEACDNGPANSDNAFCTVDCLLNFCGDGKLFVGWELCDEGDANSDDYGSICDAQCDPGARCGDHILQPAEQCDLGADNGGPTGDDQGILCDASCKSKALRAFVTSQPFTGDLGGLDGADNKCRDAASAAGLSQPHRFHAYLSTPDSSANDRFPGLMAEALPYVLVTGKKLSDSHAKLIAEGPQGEGLSITEFGTSLYDEPVATNTSPSGDRYSPDQHCLAWTSADPLLKARVGLTYPSEPEDLPSWLADGGWTSWLTRKCEKPQLHLYCLEI